MTKQTQDWWKTSIEVADLSPRFFISALQTVYVGDPNPDNHEDLHDPSLNVKLPMLSMREDNAGSFVIPRAIIDQPDSMVSHLQSLISVAYEHGRKFDNIRHHFWIRGALISNEPETQISFPWYDTVSEFERFNIWLAYPQHNNFWDIEQGWELKAHFKNGMVYLRESDDDGVEEYVNLKTEHTKLLSQMSENFEELKTAIAIMSKALGEDVWSAYVRHEPRFKGVERKRKRIGFWPFR